MMLLLLLSKINTIYYLLYTTDHQLLANVAQTNLVNNTSNWRGWKYSKDGPPLQYYIIHKPLEISKLCIEFQSWNYQYNLKFWIADLIRGCFLSLCTISVVPLYLLLLLSLYSTTIGMYIIIYLVQFWVQLLLITYPSKNKNGCTFRTHFEDMMFASVCTTLLPFFTRPLVDHQ